MTESFQLERRIAERFARHALLDMPTPLQFLPRFSSAVGAEIYIKRDDCGAFALAGAKARKLERIIAEARRQGCTTLLTAGPGQSNTARVVAAACATAGLHAEILLRDAPGEALEGNALISRLTGATVIQCGEVPWPELDEYLRERARRRPDAYVVPFGGTTPSGVAGMLAGYLEMLAQLQQCGVTATAVYHASATGGIWAGLELGAVATTGPRPRPVVVIDDVYPDMRQRYADIFNEAADALSWSAHMRAESVRLDERAMGTAYGEPTEAALEAIGLLMRTEGILCDHIYTGKALAALVADARADRLAGPVVFWHSGGLPGIMTSTAMRVLNRAQL